MSGDHDKQHDGQHNGHIDEVSGIETTGHSWDGIRELNNPLPRWWLWTWYATIIWAIGFTIAYPAWPMIHGYTKGVLGYSQRAEVARQVAAAKAGQSQLRNQLAKTPIKKIAGNPELLRFALAGGKAAFGDNCAPCHGRGAQGGVGYPNLNDDDWLWGGKITDILQTITHGIRAPNDDDTRLNDMPKFGLDKMLDKKQINDVAEYVLSLSGKSQDKAAATRGKAVFDEQCVACHGDNGKGMQELGGPKLADAIWLYGGTKADLVRQINIARGGLMPAWGKRLDPVTIKSLAVYVYSLGGGQ